MSDPLPSPWRAVAERRLLAHASWCSVFNECRQGDVIGLKTERVDRCPGPYTQ